MSEPDMATGPFNLRAAREQEWYRLDQLVTIAEKKSPRALSDEDLMALPVLYRSTLSSLSVARETSLDLELITYLESLCARAYFFVYGVRTSPWRRINQFFVRDWPAAVRSLWRETLIATMLTVIGAVVGFLLVRSDPVWFELVVPEELANGRNFSASAEFLRGTLYGSEGKDWLSIFATFLFTHNSQVAIPAFALGFAFGVPTVFLLIYNGGTLGAFFALFGAKGLGAPLGGWLIIHGTTEIFAIILAGAAGLRIGWQLVFPGRVVAARRGNDRRPHGRDRDGRRRGHAVGCRVLEGIGRQTITSDLARYAIGISMLLIWLMFYYWPRRDLHG